MPLPISEDLRERIVRAYAEHEGSYSELAQRFAVGYATVSRILRRFRERGDVKPDPHGGGQRPAIRRDQYPALLALVREKPDRTVDQIRHAWQLETGEKLSRSAMVRALRKAGLSWKKNGSARQSSFVWTSRKTAQRSSNG